MEKAGQELDNAHRDIKQGLPSEQVAEGRLALVRAQEALKEADAKKKEIEEMIKSIEVASNNLEDEKDNLLKEKSALIKDKSDLESREKLFTMGFYASFSTALIAIFGIMFKLPTVRLERKLKALEIQEKETVIQLRLAELNGKLEPNN